MINFRGKKDHLCLATEGEQPEEFLPAPDRGGKKGKAKRGRHCLPTGDWSEFCPAGKKGGEATILCTTFPPKKGGLTAAVSIVEPGDCGKWAK